MKKRLIEAIRDTMTQVTTEQGQEFKKGFIAGSNTLSAILGEMMIEYGKDGIIPINIEVLEIIKSGIVKGIDLD